MILLWLNGRGGGTAGRKLVERTTLGILSSILIFPGIGKLYIMGLLLAGVGGRTLMVAELNMAGIYSEIKGARLIGFLFSEL